MADSPITVHSASVRLTALGRRLAVLGGASAALVSLFHDAPAWVASLRGLAAFLAVVLVTRWAARWLSWSLAGDGHDTTP